MLEFYEYLKILSDYWFRGAKPTTLFWTYPKFSSGHYYYAQIRGLAPKENLIKHYTKFKGVRRGSEKN